MVSRQTDRQIGAARVCRARGLNFAGGVVSGMPGAQRREAEPRATVAWDSAWVDMKGCEGRRWVMASG